VVPLRVILVIILLPASFADHIRRIMNISMAVRMADLAVAQVKLCKVEELDHVESNGQHVQRFGHVLAMWDGNEIYLYHPHTKTETGHYDLAFVREPIRLIRYSGGEQVILQELAGRLNSLWPDGPEHLLEVLIVIEKMLEVMCPYCPIVLTWAVEGISHKQHVHR